MQQAQATVERAEVKPSDRVVFDRRLSRGAMELYYLLLQNLDLPNEAAARSLGVTPKVVAKFELGLIRAGYLEVSRIRDAQGVHRVRRLTTLAEAS